MKPSRIKIIDICTDAGTQIREAISEPTVSDYAERMTEGDAFPPVTLFHDGNNHYCADGFHRIMAATRVGFVEIDAVVHKGTLQDAVWFALGANKANGHRLTRGDLRNAVLLALHQFPEKTQKSIAGQVGCTQGYVAKVKEDVIPSNNVPTTRTDSLGRVQPTRKPHKIPRTPEEEEEMYLGKQETQTNEGGKRTVKTTIKPPCDGMQFARMAVLDLQQIKHNDAERKEAFEYVRNWINENEKA